MPKNLLLADDSITIQKVVAITFANEDYAVTVVDNGEAALAKARAARPDVVLLDVVMPKKNGREALEEISLIRPGVKALFISGYTADIVSRNGLIDSGFELLMKPLLPNQLLGKIREMLDREGVPEAKE